MAELLLDNLGKVYPSGRGTTPVRALGGLSLRAGPGECIALLGPSGAGKSTLLRLIAGLENPTEGEARLAGQSLLSRRPADRQVGMAFQYPALLPQLSAGENLRLGPKLRGLRDTDGWMERLINLLGIAPLLDRKPETLSGGEQQRIALGRALATRPQLLLLDEPLASLDPLSRIELRTVIRRVQRELAVTTLYVTHDQAEACEIADQIAVLQQGRLEQFGTSEQLYRTPANLFVARFFGPDRLNVLRGRIALREKQVIADLGHLSLPIPGLKPDWVGREIFAGFRPGSVSVTSASTSSVWIVRERRALGWNHLLYLTSETEEIISCSPFESPLRAGDTVHLQIDPAQTLLFDPVSQDRIAIESTSPNRP